MVVSWFCSHLLFAIDKSSKKKLEGQLASCAYGTSALGRNQPYASAASGHKQPFGP